MFPVPLLHDKAKRLGLEYLLIGGHAVNAYCEPRTTLDVDFLVRKKDRAKWVELLEAEGFRPFRNEENFVQFSPPYGVEWRLDLMLVNDETFAKLTRGKTEVHCLGVPTQVPSVEHLISMKLHALRHGPADRFGKDFTDIVRLVRAGKLNVNSESVKSIFQQYGTAEIYERAREALGS